LIRIVYLALKANKSAKSAVTFLNEAKAFYPYPITKLLTDNGKEFTDRFIKGRKEPSENHPFDVECKKHQIEHRLTRPYTPKTNGRVERFNGRIAEILRHNHFDDYDKLSQALEYYLRCYNFFNKQKNLGYKTPAEKMKDWYEKDRKFFKDNFDIDSYNLAQPNKYYLRCYNFFNKQKNLGYKTPAEKVKDWYEKDRKLFKDNFDIDSYNLAQPNRYIFAIEHRLTRPYPPRLTAWLNALMAELLRF